MIPQSNQSVQSLAGTINQVNTLAARLGCLRDRVRSFEFCLHAKGRTDVVREASYVR